jgi:hypothetical protein
MLIGPASLGLWGAGFDGRPKLRSMLGMAAAIPGMGGWAAVAGILTYGLAQRDYPWAPTSGLPFLIIGIPMATLVLIGVIVNLVPAPEIPGALWQPWRGLLAFGLVLIALSLAGAQLGRIAPLGIVITAAVLTFLTTLAVVLTVSNCRWSAERARSHRP